MNNPVWITVLGFVVPALGLAGSAVAFVVKLFQDAAEAKRRRFFEMMTYLDGGGPIAAKLAAAYALRQFPEHQEFVERFCRSQIDQIKGDNILALQKELDLTANAVSKVNGQNA